jgi:hypothetical protein
LSYFPEIKVGYWLWEDWPKVGQSQFFLAAAHPETANKMNMNRLSNKALNLRFWKYIFTIETLT